MKALPDATINVTHEIVSGPWIVQEFTKVSGQCVSITRYENDLGVESRLYFDVVQLLSQLGVMPVASKN